MGQEDVGLIHRTKSYTKMKITPEEKKRLEELYQKFLNDEKVKRMIDAAVNNETIFD